MTMEVKNIKKLGIVALMAGAMLSCKGDEQSPGMEYMPDMYRSPAVEGYWDYAEIQGKYSEDAYNKLFEKYSFAPPAGTIPYAGPHAGKEDMPYEHGAPIGADKTHGLYGVRQDSAGILNAKWDKNPIAFSDEALKDGQVLYERFCSHCHGMEGAGDGAIPGTGKFPAPGAFSGPLKDKTGGEIFYTITYGKGAMGSHASQLNKEERWKVVYYVQKLQGNDPGAETTSDTVAVDQPAVQDDAPIVPEENAHNTH
ncbi:MAG: cytochrome c [Crocinitomicaceae bacterium]|nr:cytochrome c [Crocinitomicaceae bacterium]